MLVVKFGGSQKLHVYFQLCRVQHPNPYTVQGWTVNTMEYHSALKKKEILPYVTTDGQRGHYAQWNKPDTSRQILHEFISMWEYKKVEFVKAEHRMVLSGAGRMGKWGNLVKGYKVSARQDNLEIKSTAGRWQLLYCTVLKTY